MGLKKRHMKLMFGKPNPLCFDLTFKLIVIKNGFKVFMIISTCIVRVDPIGRLNAHMLWNRSTFREYMCPSTTV